MTKFTKRHRITAPKLVGIFSYKILDGHQWGFRVKNIRRKGFATRRKAWLAREKYMFEQIDMTELHPIEDFEDDPVN